MKPARKSIDIHAEISAVVGLISKKWTPIDSLEALVSEIQVKAFTDWRAAFDNSAADFSPTISDLIGKRQQALSTQLSGIELDKARDFDRPTVILKEILSASLSLQPVVLDLDGKWNFSRSASTVSRGARLRHPDLAGALPLGWRELRIGYQAHDGMAEYDLKADADLFEGTDLEAARTQPLHQMISLPQVMHNDVYDGKRPSDSLVSSIYSHFLGVRQLSNTLDLVAAIKNLTDWDAPGLVIDPVMTTEQPLLGLILKMSPEPGTLQQFFESVDASVKAIAAHALLTDAEKQARKEKLLNEVRAMSASFDNPTVQQQAEKAAELLRIHTLLIETFGTNHLNRQDEPDLAL